MLSLVFEKLVRFSLGIIEGHVRVITSVNFARDASIYHWIRVYLVQLSKNIFRTFDFRKAQKLLKTYLSIKSFKGLFKNELHPSKQIAEYSSVKTFIKETLITAFRIFNPRKVIDFSLHHTRGLIPPA